MTYTGEIHNGTLVIDGPASLPEGSPFTCLNVPIAIAENLPQAETNGLFDDLMEFAGKVQDLPADASINVAHYI